MQQFSRNNLRNVGNLYSYTQITVKHFKDAFILVTQTRTEASPSLERQFLILIHETERHAIFSF